MEEIRGVDDAEIQILRQKLEVPLLRCPAGKIITDICTVDQCKAKCALFCDDEGCDACKEHLNCSAIRLSRLTNMVQGQTNPIRYLILRLVENENEMIDQIRMERRRLMERFLWAGLPEQFRRPIDEIFRQGRNDALPPRLASEMVMCLRMAKEKD